MSLEAKAKNFAERAHRGQVRKYTGEPYINHPEAVADIVRGVPHTEAMILAAWLHDVAEDTSVTLDEIKAEFGPEVGRLVYYLTDPEHPGNRATRKALDRQRLAAAPVAAKTIKLADLIHNTMSIVERDPKFARIYLAEKRLLLTESLMDGDRTLWKRAFALLALGESTVRKKLVART